MSHVLLEVCDLLTFVTKPRVLPFSAWLILRLGVCNILSATILAVGNQRKITVRQNPVSNRWRSSWPSSLLDCKLESKKYVPYSMTLTEHVQALCVLVLWNFSVHVAAYFYGHVYGKVTWKVGAPPCSEYKAFPLLPLEGLGTRLAWTGTHRMYACEWTFSLCTLPTSDMENMSGASESTGSEVCLQWTWKIWACMCSTYIVHVHVHVVAVCSCCAQCVHICTNRETLRTSEAPMRGETFVKSLSSIVHW